METVMKFNKNFLYIFSKPNKNLQIDWSPLGKNRKNITKENDICPFCDETETIEHFLSFHQDKQYNK